MSSGTKLDEGDFGEFDRLLDLFCPLHVRLDATGHIRHAGPTMQRVGQEVCIEGVRFLEVFELVRPAGVSTMAALRKAEGATLRLRLRAYPSVTLKGVLACPSKGGGAIVTLSFGISVQEALRRFGLSSSDFAPTDLTVEMLYLIEARSLAMNASRLLNLRLQGARIEAEKQAYTDPLTGLANRRAVDDILPKLIARGGGIALMQLDLDFFKEVNDTLGHAAGDHILNRVSEVLRAAIRKGDWATRTGGDEFVLIFDGLVHRGELENVASRIIQQLEVPVIWEAGTGDDGTPATVRISGSIGIAVRHDHDVCDAALMMETADRATYAAKAAGRGCARFASLEGSAKAD